MDQLERVDAGQDGLAAIFTRRMALWAWFSLAGVAGLYLWAPHMIGVLAFKVVLLTVAAWLGYWISRALERGRRPHELKAHAYTHRENGREERAVQLEQMAMALLLRRTIIVSACMIASALGG